MADPNKNGPLEVDEFRRLLKWLNPDPDHAGEAYERIRRKLLRFFEWRRQSGAEELVDRAIDRVTRKLALGEVLTESEPVAFFYGVARNILREHSADQFQQRSALLRHALPEPTLAVEQEDAMEPRLECLDRCLSRLPLPDRELILAYYQGKKREKIENRKALADRLGIPMNALWIRSHRLRSKLESCIDECVARSRAAKVIDEDSH